MLSLRLEFKLLQGLVLSINSSGLQISILMLANSLYLLPTAQ